MPQVLLRDLDRHAASDGVARVRVAHPVRAGLRKPLGPLRIAQPSQRAGTARKERPDLVVESRRCDPLQRFDRLPGAQPRSALRHVAGLAQQKRPLISDDLRVGTQPPRHQASGQLAHHIGRQRNLSLLLPLADDAQQPALHGFVFMRVGRVLDPLQVIDPGRHHFRQPQPGCIQKVQPKDQPLVRRSLRQHLQLPFDEAPLRQAEAASRIHLRPRGPRHDDR